MKYYLLVPYHPVYFKVYIYRAFRYLAGLGFSENDIQVVIFFDKDDIADDLEEKHLLKNMIVLYGYEVMQVVEGDLMSVVRKDNKLVKVPCYFPGCEDEEKLIPEGVFVIQNCASDQKLCFMRQAMRKSDIIQAITFEDENAPQVAPAPAIEDEELDYVFA